MNKKSIFFFTFYFASFSIWGQTIERSIVSSESKMLNNGFYVQKIVLNNNEVPQIKIEQQEFVFSKLIVSDSLLNSANTVKVDIGVERKKTYAFVRIPAFRKNEQGVLEQLKQYTIKITEKSTTPNLAASASAQSKTTTTSSVLANGSWQKISIDKRGVYKVDYDFVKNTLGQVGSISSPSIRLFGNGGTMLYEANAVPRPYDLLENAIEMYDGGDGIFGAGDYFLFYANGPTEWLKDSVNQQFKHRTNLYADKSYYFISFDNGLGLRINNASAAGSATSTVTSYNEYALHEKELVNLGLFGKVWWGETFGFNGSLSNTQTISFPLPDISDSVKFNYQLANASVNGNGKFTVTLNSTLIGNHDNIHGITGVDGDNPGVSVQNSGTVLVPSSGTLNFNILYEKYSPNAKGYLDYIEINTRRRLAIPTSGQITFRDWISVAPASVAQFNIQNANSNTLVWDVTNPLQPLHIVGTLAGSTYSFVQNANTLREYAATNNNFMTVQYVGTVPNQNLHGLSQTDYVIVTHPDMMEAANKLADFHRSYSKLNVETVSIDQVYNEFASGAKDISAIRDFMKMLYDRAGKDASKMPKYLLLLGQASFDYKNIIPNNAKIVPTFETEESLNATYGHCTDDFYALLDSAEDITTGKPLLDIGVGRIPATNADQAMAIINKIIRYKQNEALGVWRLNNVYMGDKEDSGGNHLLDADEMYQTVESASDLYKAQKVYLDNMNIISTPGGPRCPDANKVINDNVFKGAFLLNYSGHGSIYTLSTKRIITQDDYNTWKNPYKMPIMITATCDFSRFDNPALQSAGEKIMLKSDGGAIALVTTTQVVYASSNNPFNKAYLEAQFTKRADGWNSFGDAFRISKNIVVANGDVINSRKFALLGDPALIPDFPRYDVVTDSAKSLSSTGVASSADSIKSLGRYKIFGSIRNDAGALMADFNGKANITFFDKEQKVSVRTDNSGSSSRTFALQNNIIYKGTATVSNGVFSFEFITPKDINYEFGKGKISYYADNGSIDAAGADTTFTVGGFSDDLFADDDAPVVRAFMNDSLFKDGGLTGTNSVLYAIITDKSGINVSGNFIGHDLTAILDDVAEAPYVLNDYYETAPNTYQRGYVNFPITGLSNGMHTLRIKAWDVFNNSGEGTVRFEVLDGKVVAIRNIATYPNPFRDITHFVFEHNHPNEALKATVYIFNTAGALVRTIEQNFTPTGSNSSEITWDGTGNNGEKLFSGVYPFRIRIATEKNIEDLGYQKVILIR
ncbi:MAG: type IX secretion system sortase PorU [Phycisphaerales bacterium]|nr:type IX secretion system sortase PorU [Phycisphaerales bacterium]